MASWEGEQGYHVPQMRLYPSITLSSALTASRSRSLPSVSWLFFILSGIAAGAEVKRDPHLDLAQTCLPDLLLAVPGPATLHPVPSVRGPQDLGLVPWTLPSVGSVIPFSGWRLGTWGVLQVTISSAWTPGFHWHLTSLTLTSCPEGTQI